MNRAKLIIFCVALAFPCTCKGSFTFNKITSERNKSCDGTAYLLWNYTTDETVTVIEWYNQPDVLIARIFGVNVGAPFTVLPPYNDPTMYNVTRYNPSEYNAAIKVTGMTSTDNGVYSVNVTAASPQSSILYRTFLNDLDPECNAYGGTSQSTAHTNSDNALERSGVSVAGKGNMCLLAAILFVIKVCCEYFE